MNGTQRGWCIYYQIGVGPRAQWRIMSYTNTREAAETVLADIRADNDGWPAMAWVGRLPRRFSRDPYTNWGMRGIGEQMASLVAPFGRRFWAWYRGKPAFGTEVHS